MKSRLLRRKRAFTLIELLVVILILAILASLIIPRLLGRTGDAKRAKAASDIATLSGLLHQYRIQLRRQRDQTDIGRVALIARARMRNAN